MKSLNRPMFKRGGKVSSRNNGIVSGFENGGRVGLENGGDPQSMLELAESMYSAPVKPSGFSQSDYLRLAAAGADIMGAQPTGRSGFIGALQAASPALGSLGRDLGQSIGEREARYQAQLDARNKFLLGAGIKDAEYERDVAREDFVRAEEKKYRTDELEQENKYKLEQIALDAELNPNDLVFYTRQYNKLVEEQSEYNSESPEYERIQRQMDKLSEKYMAPIVKELSKNILNVQGASEYAAAKIEEIDRKRAAAIPPKDPLTESEKVDLKPKFEGMYYNIQAEASLTSIDPGTGLAEGGRVGLQEGGDPMMAQQAQPNSVGLTFEELRARLPQEVTDGVVRLLATSEEALLAFANLETQEDIAQFNQKYNTDLQLPAQVA
jgi:hypothetical protein